MILVLAGTRDGRKLAAELVEAGFSVIASVVSDYGRELINDRQITVHSGPLDRQQLVCLIRDRNIAAVVDASHPYAQNVSCNAIEACRLTAVKYLRYERPAVALPAYAGLHPVPDYPTAAKTAAGLGRIVFLTTGSRHLQLFKSEPQLTGHRLIARVLPDPAVMQACIEAGFNPGDIIALQGPFSHELNVALFREYHAEVIVTKNSGSLGGSDTKITAAIELGLPIVIIDRPLIAYPCIVSSRPEVISLLKECL